MTVENNNHTDAPGNLEKVQGELVTVAREAGRDPQSVALVAVSKTHPADAIRPVLGLVSGFLVKTGFRKPKASGRN